MNLTQAQKVTLKAHIAANTNTTPATDSAGQPLVTPFVINTQHTSNDSEKERAIAEWYNGIALVDDNQAFSAPLSLWRPDVTIQELNAAIVWGTPIPGSGANATEINTDRIVKWLTWQSLTWNSRLDLTDAQQRAGVFAVFGNSPAATTVAIATSGRRNPTRLEMVFAGAAVGQAGIGGNLGRVCPAGIYNEKISGPEINNVVLNG